VAAGAAPLPPPCAPSPPPTHPPSPPPPHFREARDRYREYHTRRTIPRRYFQIRYQIGVDTTQIARLRTFTSDKRAGRGNKGARRGPTGPPNGRRAAPVVRLADDAATRALSCRFLMSKTRDIVRRFEVSISSDPARPRLALRGNVRAARPRALIALRGCDRSAPFAAGHEFVGVTPRGERLPTNCPPPPAPRSRPPSPRRHGHTCATRSNLRLPPPQPPCRARDRFTSIVKSTRSNAFTDQSAAPFARLFEVESIR